MEGLKKYYLSIIVLLIIIFGVYLWYMFENMELKKETEHFRYYSTFKDKKILDEFSTFIEYNYNKMSKDLKIELDDKIDIKIYSNMFNYKRGVSHCTWSDKFYIYSCAQFTDIRLLSPQYKRIDNWDKKDAYNSALHSLIHILMNERNENFSKMPMWITEGFANYKTYNKNIEYKRKVKKLKKEDVDFKVFEIPHNRSVLISNGFTPFINKNGYEYSYTIIDYIINEYGRDKMYEIIDNYENPFKVLDVERELFIKNWENYLKVKY